MKGRGTRLFVISMTLCILAMMAGHASPAESAGSLRPRSFAFDRLCQDRAGDEIDYSSYFTAPEREGGSVYVFYNNIIEPDDDAQFAYALLYGLEFAAAKAGQTDVLAVGIYFSDGKGKIYGIGKRVFDVFHQKKMDVNDLLKYLAVKDVDLSDRTIVGTKGK